MLTFLRHTETLSRKKTACKRSGWLCKELKTMIDGGDLRGAKHGKITAFQGIDVPFTYQCD